MKKLFAIILSVLMLVSLCACSAKPAEEGGAAGAKKSFTVTVVHHDGSQEDFTYETSEEKLGGFLEAEGLILSEGADDGMFHTVDGEKADWNVDQSYWAFYIGNEYAMTGIYDTDITDGARYRLEYTIG